MILKKMVLTLLLLAGIVLLMEIAFRADLPVRAMIVKVQEKGWNNSSSKKYCSAVSRYGDWPELMALGVVGFFIARKNRNVRWQRIFVMAMVASTLAGAVTNTLRLTTGRTRPRVSPAREQAWYGPYHEGKWTIGRAEMNSFPSGHTATAFGFAFIIFFANPACGLPTLLLAALIASSRLLLGAHHPSDLMAAILLAFGISQLCWNYFKKNPAIFNFLERSSHATNKSDFNS